MSNAIALRPTYWASVSGGKDSLYMFYYIMNHLEEYPINGAVHFELEIDYPFIHEVVDYMESECNKMGIPFIRIRPSRRWSELYEIWGYPTKYRRWCNSQYKLDCKKQFTLYLKEKGMHPIWYIGFCVDEAKRFKASLFDTDANCRYPLAEQGVYEYDIWQWAQGQEIFNDFYKYNKRCGCMGCPLSSYVTSAYDSVYYPELYETYMEAALKTEQDVFTRTGKHISVWQGNSKYDTVYRRKVLESKYIPMIKEQL